MTPARPSGPLGGALRQVGAYALGLAAGVAVLTAALALETPPDPALRVHPLSVFGALLMVGLPAALVPFVAMRLLLARRRWTAAWQVTVAGGAVAALSFLLGALWISGQVWPVGRATGEVVVELLAVVAAGAVAGLVYRAVGGFGRGGRA